MIRFAISLAFFVALASAHAVEEPNIVELKKTVLEKDAEIEKMSHAYQAAGYYMMGNITSGFALGWYQQNKTASFPTDLPFDNLTIAQRCTHDQIIMNAKILKRYWYIISSPTQLSDALKGEALLVYVNKTINHDFKKPFPADILDAIQQTIKQEKGVLVDGRLLKPNKELEVSYQALGEITREKNFDDHWLASRIYIDNIQDHCALPSSNCSISLRQAFDKFVAVDKNVRDHNTPIDSQEKVNILIRRLPEHLEAMQSLLSILRAEKLEKILDFNACAKYYGNGNSVNSATANYSD